jgi:hypothetical protein
MKTIVYTKPDCKIAVMSLADDGASFEAPAGQRAITVTGPLPDDVPPELWVVDWATGAVTVDTGSLAASERAANADAIHAAFDAAVTAALGSPGRQGSMARYHDSLNSRAVLEQGRLSAEELVDIATFATIDAWEARMIDTREAAIDLALPAGSIDWPAPPAGLPAFLKGF